MPYCLPVPHWSWMIVFSAFNLGAVVLLVYWSALLFRLLQILREVPGVHTGLDYARRSPSQKSVTLIIPAHNEADAFTRLLPSLVAQDFPRLRVILCLDRCTDATSAVARRLIAADPRFEIVEIETCPPDWAGKVNAVSTGVRRALDAPTPPDLLLFADADTVFHPSCISAAVGLLESRGLDLVTLLSTMTYSRWFEWAVQPAAGMELMRQYPLDRVNRRSGRRRSFANGQFMLFTRNAYTTVGGHAAVKDELLEDLALARAVHEGWGGLSHDGTTKGGVIGLFPAADLLTCRMYDTWAQFREGWKRIYIESAKRSLSRLWSGKLVSLWLAGIGPILAVIYFVEMFLLMNRFGIESKWGAWLIVGAVLSGLAILVGLSSLLLSFRLVRAPLWAIAVFPVGAILVARILREAAQDLRRRVPVRWGGREYVREPR